MEFFFVGLFDDLLWLFGDGRLFSDVSPVPVVLGAVGPFLSLIVNLLLVLLYVLLLVLLDFAEVFLLFFEGLLGIDKPFLDVVLGNVLFHPILYDCRIYVDYKIYQRRSC